MSRSPNIFLFISDQQRTDSLGCYGNPHGTTPNIDAMAETGLRFETCYSTSPLCVPARSQLLSGKHCHETGNMGNQAWRFHTDQPVEVDGVCLDPAGSTLPAQMAASGYPPLIVLPYTARSGMTPYFSWAPPQAILNPVTTSS